MKCEKNRNLTEITMAMVMQPNQANIAGNVHGGEIMKFMDNVAGAAAIQYSRGNVVTARVDELEFIRPIHIGDFVTCTGKVAYVGRTSMEVIVMVDVENLISESEKTRALTAFFTMVSLDENGKPNEVPKLIPETDKEKQMYAMIEDRKEAYRKRREEAKKMERL